MELYPLEDASAAAASLVLASRKHSKLVEKVQGKGGPGWPSWGAKGRPRGKGDWAEHGDGGSKGKKGKGDRKGKGNGKYNSPQAADQGAAEWARTKDKPEGAK
jgi:hypothetical protein